MPTSPTTRSATAEAGEASNFARKSGPTDDSYTVRMTAFVRLATDENGNGPSACTVQNYVEQGLLPALRDSSGRLLFRASDAKRAVQIYQARKARHGATGVRGFRPVTGLTAKQLLPGKPQE